MLSQFVHKKIGNLWLRYLSAALIAFSVSNTVHAALNQLPRKSVEYQTIQGKIIDETNLYSVSPQLEPNTAKALDEWAHEHKSFLHKIVPKNDAISIEQSKKTAAGNHFAQEIKNAGFANLSKQNCAIPLKLDGKEYFLRFAGPWRRSVALLSGNPHILDQKNYKDELLTHRKTQQTASQVANYLLYQQVVQQKKLTSIELAKTYLVQVPERDCIKDNLSDETCMVLQEAIEPSIKCCSKKNVAGIFPTYAQLNQLHALTKYALLWDTSANVLMSKDGKKIHLVDFEQPWEENSEYFFNKNDWMIQDRIFAGLHGLCQIGSDVWEKKSVDKSTPLFQNSIQVCHHAITLIEKDAEIAALDKKRAEKVVQKYQNLYAHLVGEAPNT